jgi:hypothetical protein
MLAVLARWLAPVLHTPPGVSSALCRTLTRVNARLLILTHAKDGRVAASMLMHLVAPTLASALLAFPGDAAVMNATLEFFHTTVELPQAADAEAADAMAVEVAAALLRDADAQLCGSLSRFAVCCLLPDHLRKAHCSAAHAAVGVAAVRTIRAMCTSRAAPAADSQASLSPVLAPLLAPLLDALSPLAERGGAAPCAHSSVRAALFDLLQSVVRRLSVSQLSTALTLANDAKAMPAAPNVEAAPLRTGAPLPPQLFQAALGRLLVAALRDAIGAVQRAAGDAATELASAPDAWSSLDALAANSMRSQLHQALGIPPPCRVFELEIKEFQRRKGSGAAAQPCTDGAVLRDGHVAAACAGLRFAAEVAELGGDAGIAAARGVIRACKPFVLRAVTADHAGVLRTACTSLAEAAELSDILLAHRTLKGVLEYRTTKSDDRRPLFAVLRPTGDALTPFAATLSGNEPAAESRRGLDFVLHDDTLEKSAEAPTLRCFGADVSKVEQLWRNGAPCVLRLIPQWKLPSPKAKAPMLFACKVEAAPPDHERTRALQAWIDGAAPAAPAATVAPAARSLDEC